MFFNTSTISLPSDKLVKTVLSLQVTEYLYFSGNIAPSALGIFSQLCQEALRSRFFLFFHDS